MKLKYSIACIIAVLFTMLCCLPVFAVTTPETSPVDVVIDTWKSKSDKQKISDEQKSEMKAKHEAFKAAWDRLSKEQKEEIYKIHDKSFDARIELAEKYVEFGIIDRETAEKMKEKTEEHRAEMRKNGVHGFMKSR